MAMTIQAELIQKFLLWVAECPFDYTISSMQGGAIHVKFHIED